MQCGRGFSPICDPIRNCGQFLFSTMFFNAIRVMFRCSVQRDADHVFAANGLEE
jgi:hypothetical protein